MRRALRACSALPRLAAPAGHALAPAAPLARGAPARAFAHSPVDDSTAFRRAALWATGYYSEGSVLMRSARELHVGCTARADSEELSGGCALADDFRTRFQLQSLHVWLVLARLRTEGERGRALSQNMFDIFWEDLESKLVDQGFKFLEIAKFTKEFQQTFYAAAHAYDVGLVNGDAVMAGALYAHLFGGEGSVEQLAQAAAYVRREMAVLGAIDSELFVCEGQTGWAPPSR